MKSSLHRIESIKLELTPVELASRCRHLPGLIFFDSALAACEEDRISILAANPTETISGRTAEDWALLREKLRACNPLQDDSSPTPGVNPKIAALARRVPLGMAAGFVEYDGQFTFGLYHGLLAFEHSSGNWVRIGNVDWDIPTEVTKAESQKAEGSSGSLGRPEFTPSLSREEFCRMVRRAKEYIAAGDIYQVNVSQQFTARWEWDAWRFYESLRHHSAAPHATYVQLGGKTILSSSPELFLQMSGSQIITKPIKGTRPRFADPVEDEQSARELITSQKEMAELVMITDLDRKSVV